MVEGKPSKPARALRAGEKAEVLPEVIDLVESGRMAVSTPDGEVLRDSAERARQLADALRVFLRRMADFALLEGKG